MPSTLATSTVPEVREYFWRVAVTKEQLSALGEATLESFYRGDAAKNGTPIPSGVVKKVYEETVDTNLFYIWTFRWYVVEFEDEALDTKRIEKIE